MKTTKDYSIFKKNISNREIDHRNLKKIIMSIQSRNMLNLRPIVVNSNMEIVDGQHRLAAAKHLDLEVEYVIQDDLNDEDIILLNNNQKKWSLEDYLNFYVTQGSEEYVKFKNFMDKYSIKDITSNLLVMSGTGGGYLEEFRSGRLKIRKTAEDFENKYDLIKETIEIVDKASMYKKHYFTKMKFVRALMLLANKENFDNKTFIHKLSLVPDYVHSCATVKAYYEMLKEIYNYKNKANPIAD